MSLLRRDLYITLFYEWVKACEQYGANSIRAHGAYNEWVGTNLGASDSAEVWKKVTKAIKKEIAEGGYP